MENIRLLVIGDVHICDHSPGRRQDGFKDHIMAKLEECLEIAREREATHIIFMGDIFHLKAANRVSHRLVQELVRLMQRFKVPVYILVGNHDITDYSLESISKQPIGVLGLTDNVHLLTTEPVDLADDMRVFPVPGIHDATLEDFQVERVNKRDIMLVHQSIVPDIEKEPEVFRHVLFDAKEVAKQTDVNIILYGHQHRQDGIYAVEREDGTKAVFSNQGAISRLTIDDNDVNKIPRVLFLDIAADEARTVTPEVITLQNVLSAEDAYRLDDHMEELEKALSIDDTIKKLRQTEVSVFSIDGVVTEIEHRKDLDDPIRQKALSLLELVK